MEQGKEVAVKNSMLYWWPEVKDLQIPVPETVIVEVPFKHLVSMLDDVMLPREYVELILSAKDMIGFPLFLRTDMASAKHHWEGTCFVSNVEELFRHIWSLIDETLAAGMFGELDPNALVFREFLKLNSFFTAFNGLPISAERRYFIRDGAVECHHPYWIQDAIEKSWRKPIETDWKERLAALNKESAEEVKLLTDYATRIGKVLDGYWSIDFAEAEGHTWYLIDMAEGEGSWHPQDCKLSRKT